MQKTDFNVSPYYDDYDPSKLFHRILFRPRTVQTRELNQMQAILQNQIESMSDHIFKEGANVVGGEIGITQYDNTLGITITAGTMAIFQTALESKELYIQHQTTGAQIHVTKLLEASGALPITVIGNEVDGTSSGESITFNVSDNINFLRIIETGTITKIGTASINQVGTSTVANIEKGIFYIRGFMVATIEQYYVVDRFDPKVSARVGLSVTESIVTSDMDNTLLSNATGQPNHRAAGADRLKLELKLEHKPLDDSDHADFFETKRIELGRLINGKDNTTEYNELGHLLAKRQFETNGNYTVVQHSMDIREHLLNGNNGGVYLPTDGGVEDKFVSLINPGISYVAGYRIENIDPTLISIEKARETAIFNNVVGGITWDGFFTLKAGTETNEATFKGTPEINTGAQYSLYNDSTLIGNAVGVGVIFENKELKLYMRNIQMVAGRDASQIDKISLINGGVTKFEADIARRGYTTSDGLPLIFRMPISGIRAITDASYLMVKSYEFTANASGIGTINAGSGLQFSPETNRYIVGYAQIASGGLIQSPILTLGGAVSGTTLTVNVGANAANEVVRVTALVVVNNPSVKSKTLMTHTENVIFSNQSSVILTKYDVVDMSSVISPNNEEVISQFKLNSGQKDSSYDLGSISNNAGTNLTGTYSITYRYFEHGSGNYFAPESYGNVPRNVVEEYQSQNGQIFDQFECIDFRRRADQWNTPSSLVMPNSSFQADVEYYLNRIDSIYLSSRGEFGVSTGVPNLAPEQPEIPDNSMRLFDLFIPAYTSDIDRIQIATHNYKRYRMEDIQKLENRIENIEYYTTLSQLEASADNIQVIDPTTGLNRFKNGIFADPFSDFRMLDPNDKEFSGSIDVRGDGSDEGTQDQNSGSFRPEVIENGMDMVWVGSSNVENRDDMIGQIAASVVESTKQPYATDWINVNPYEAFSWAGNLRLNPSRDFWWDTKWVAPRVINKTVDNRGGQRAGTYYGSWERARGGLLWASWFRRNRRQSRTITQVTETSHTKSNTNTATLRTEVIPYMRKISIRVSVSGMRPNTYVWPFFANRMIQAYCQQDGKTRGATLRTDGNGALNATFFVPNDNTMRFNTGRASMVLVDNKTNPNDPKNRSTFATANFESGGTLATKQATHTYTRYLGASKRTSIEYRRVDPVAQSFTITTPGGEMVDGVEIFFRTKSRNIPVTLEIRGMENGLPTHEVLERKVLNPEHVSLSTNGLTPTYFRFDKPLYLEEEKEYAIVIIANTIDYHVYFAQLGRKVLHTGYALAKQPNTGVMFTSANGSTWTAHQNRDLKFTVKRNSYTAQNTDLMFKGKEIPQAIPLGSNPFETVAGNSNVHIHIPGHAFKIGDKVTVTNAIGSNNINTNSLNKEHTVTGVNDKYIEVSTTDTANASGRMGGENATSQSRYSMSQLFTSVESVARHGTEISWFYRAMQNNSRTVSQWIQFNPKNTIQMPFIGTYLNPEDFEIKATCKSTTTLIPQIDMHGFVTLMNSFIVSNVMELCNGVTQDVYFTNPSTSLKLFVGSTLPVGSNMKIYVKTLRGESSEEVSWVELKPTVPILNSTIPVEQKYELNVVKDNAFNGIKIKIALTGDRLNMPLVNDMRGIALA